MRGREGQGADVPSAGERSLGKPAALESAFGGKLTPTNPQNRIERLPSCFLHLKVKRGSEIAPPFTNEA